jgi:hypothetical protein
VLHVGQHVVAISDGELLRFHLCSYSTGVCVDKYLFETVWTS